MGNRLNFYSAAALLAVQSAVIATTVPSVRLSVHLSHAGIVRRRRKIESCGFRCEVEKALLFSDINNGWGRRLLPRTICTQINPPI